MFKKYIKFIFHKLYMSEIRANSLNLEQGSALPADLEMISSELTGKVVVGPGCRIENSKINGQVFLDGKNKIENSFISGNVSLGKGSKIITGAIVAGNIRIGRYTSVNGPNTDIYQASHVSIGHFTSIARGVSIQDTNHDISRMTTYFINHNLLNGPVSDDLVSKGGISIGNDVWIGTQSVILSGVTIGHGAVVAANSTVTTDVPPYAVVAGSPARLVKYRFSENTINNLLATQWWDLEEHEIIEKFRNFKSEI